MLKLLGQKDLEEEFLTANVEEEYDALNDETFGDEAANDDWEEAHEKLAELIEKNDLEGKSFFSDSFLENDASQDEIVSKSISQLGLEDDLDDPAIMTVSRGRSSSGNYRSIFRSSSSPPPPAILETEDCGSPKTFSIWSATPKDSGVSSFLLSLNSSSSNLSNNESSPLRKLSTDNVFITPSKTWRAEDLEKDLLSSSKTPAQSSWLPGTPSTNHSLPNQFLNNLGPIRNQVPPERMLTREEVERQIHSDVRIRCPVNVPRYGPPMMYPQMLPPPPPHASLQGNNINVQNQSTPLVPIRTLRHPMLNLLQNRLPLRPPGLPPNMPPPGFNSPNVRPFQFPIVVYNKSYYNENHENSARNTEDEYAGLMSVREKEWLYKIQLLQLNFENPYIEDYYYTTQVARKCRKKFSENNLKGAKDAPEIILPETSRHESKTFVPTQFEGSLGKLQAVSVNFPRKVLDISFQKSVDEDEETDKDKGQANQNRLKYLRLLLDIEKLYALILEIEDEERRILAKPESEGGTHRENIAMYKRNIFSGLFGDSSNDDSFQSIMSIRKGRSLVMRAFLLFSRDQQLHCLAFLFRFLPGILKKDQNDHILLQNIVMILDAILTFSLPELVKVGEALENVGPSGSSKGRERNNIMAALKNKFGSSIVCTILQRAEAVYLLDSPDSEVHLRWTKIVLHIVDCMCTMPASSIASPVNPCQNLMKHLGRFALDAEKVDDLQQRLLVFEGSGAKV